MKILMIAPQPFFQPRGTPLSVLHRMNALSKLGYAIDLVTYHIGDNIDIENVAYHRIPRLPFIKKIKIGPSKTKIILDFFLFFKALWLLITNKYDVIHSHEEAGFFGIWFAKWFDTPHIYDMHSSLPQQLTNFKFTTLKFLIRSFEKLEKNTIVNSAAVITICPELYNYVEQYFPGTNQMLIENVADNSMIFKDQKTSDVDFAADYKLNGEFIILYAGTFEPYQGIDLLIESGKKVAAQFKNVKFILVGGHPDQIEFYKSKVAAAHLDHYFVFTGQVQPNMVPKYLAAADILVTPRIEGNNTPLKIYEYLRAGKPIVATKHITHTQVLNDDVSALTECNADSFADGIMKVIQDKNYRTTIAVSAKRLAEEKYSYQAYLAKTKTIYSVLDKGRELNNYPIYE